MDARKLLCVNGMIFRKFVTVVTGHIYTFCVSVKVTDKTSSFQVFATIVNFKTLRFEYELNMSKVIHIDLDVFFLWTSFLKSFTAPCSQSNARAKGLKRKFYDVYTQ